MKAHSKRQFIFKGILFGLLAAVVFTSVTMWLWNWLMPELFGLSEITFWQALGILALSKILFGGGHPHGGHFHRYNREKYFKERFKERLEYVKKHKDDLRPVNEE